MGDESHGEGHRTGTFETRDGVTLHEESWELGAAAQAAFVIVHGYGEHCARYAPLAARLNSEGYSVYSYDQRGHGRSPGKRAYIPSFEVLPRDLDDFMAQAGPRMGERPRFMMGHSLGGLVLILYVMGFKPEVNGLVFSSSAFKVGDNVAPLTQRLSGILSVLVPWLPTLQLDAKGLSRDPEAVKRYEEDPLVYHGKIAARTGHEMMAAMKALPGRLGELRDPFIALHGTEDRLAEYEGSVLVHEGAASKDKTLKLYEGAYHEVFNDLDKDRFVQDVVDWINARR